MSVKSVGLFFYPEFIKYTKFSKNKKKTHKYSKRKTIPLKTLKKRGKYLTVWKIMINFAKS